MTTAAASASSTSPGKPPCLFCPGCQIDLLGNPETAPKQPLVTGFTYEFDVTCDCGMATYWRLDWQVGYSQPLLLSHQQTKGAPKVTAPWRRSAP